MFAPRQTWRTRPRANASLRAARTPRSCRQSGLARLAGCSPGAGAAAASRGRAQPRLVRGTSMPARALCVERRACAADAHKIDGASRRGRGAAARSTCCLRSALARRVRLLRARLAVPGGSRHSEPEARPLGAQPPPRVLEPAASKAADSTAFGHIGAARGAPARACWRPGVLGLYLTQERQPRGRT